MRVVSLLVGALLFAPQPAAPDRLLARLLENRYALSVHDGQFAGEGAAILEKAIVQSRFVVLGEIHGIAQTSELWTAVCRAAAPAGFHTMAAEEGPLAAAELQNWARRSDGASQLAAWARQFPLTIPLYETREEFSALQQCARAGGNGFRLWGLNQENLGAAGVVLSRVLASGVGSGSRPALEQLLQKNDAAYRKALQSGSIFDLFMIAAEDKELADAAALLAKDGSREAQSLFASLIESHEINRTPPVQYDNARRRERLMKTQFAANYTRAEKSEAAAPKVLLKFGALHGYRGLNPVHGSGIGNYIGELAESLGAQSLHIYVLPVKGRQPIYPRVGQPAQLAPFNFADQAGWRYLQPIFGNLLPQGWTLFDLRALRREAAAPPGARVAIDPDLATLIFGYDILVVVPEGTPNTQLM
jgi:hypothetical protein